MLRLREITRFLWVLSSRFSGVLDDKLLSYTRLLFISLSLLASLHIIMFVKQKIFSSLQFINRGTSAKFMAARSCVLWSFTRVFSRFIGYEKYIHFLCSFWNKHGIQLVNTKQQRISRGTDFTDSIFQDLMKIGPEATGPHNPGCSPSSVLPRNSEFDLHLRERTL